jgi:hypothetical protein
MRSDVIGRRLKVATLALGMIVVAAPSVLALPKKSGCVSITFVDVNAALCNQRHAVKNFGIDINST